MILQKLARALRQQNWFSVLIELLIVVFGILIAIQLDNWNQERQTRAKAVQWRAAIISELAATKMQLNFRQVYYRQALNFGETALQGMQLHYPTSAAEAWETVRGAFQAGQIWPMKITGVTYREVQAASALHFVAEPKTLNQLTNYYEGSANDLEVISGFSPPFRDMIREKAPWLLQRYMWDSDCQASDFNEVSGSYVYTLVPCDKPDLDAAILAALDQSRADIDLQNKLRGRLSQLRILVDELGRHQGHIDRVIESLSKEGVEY